jgi:sugar lactone lactonase YvrE
VPREGGDAELWLADEILAPPPGFFFGANGAARDGNQLWVLNTERGAILRVPIRRDGSAGEPELFLEDPALFGVDGITLDVRGNLHVVNIYESTLLRIDPCKEIEVLVTFPPELPFATNIEFGVGRDRETAYLTIDGAADVVKLDIGVPGMPR